MLPLLSPVAIAPPEMVPVLSTTTLQVVDTRDDRAIVLQSSLSPETSRQPQFSAPQLAQAVTPDAEGTGTIATPDGNQIDITGGQLSGDGANLFHSFQEFGLTAEQIANFIASPDIQNILSSVNGGDPSIINGLLQVSGSNANLYLINPAGVVFGPEGAVSLSGSFTATTANQIGFGDLWLDVLNPADYAVLTGTPDGFTFAGTAGLVLNQGDLTVAAEQNITLLGNQVINLGTIDAPGGTITLVAIPSENLVRISQENQLLSLEITPTLTETGQLALNPLALPELLTGSALTTNNLTVVENADGTVRIESPTAGTTLEPGSLVASGDITATGSNGGQIYLFGQQVSLLNADVDAIGLSGGNLWIGGDSQGLGQLPLAEITQIDADSTVTASARFDNAGNIVVWGSELAIVDGSLIARGGELGDGGFIETSGGQLILTETPDASANNGDGGTWLIDPTDITLVVNSDGDTDSTAIAVTNINEALDLGMNVSIVTAASGASAGNITQEAGATIRKQSRTDATLSLSAINDIILNDDIDVLNSDDSIDFVGGAPLSITLTADADGDGNGAIAASPETLLETGGGDVLATGVDITLGQIDTTLPFASNGGGGGNVSLISDGNILFESIDASNTRSAIPAGDVVLEANGTVVGTGTISDETGTTIAARGTLSAAGFIGNGTVTIQHDGGPSNAAFEIGNAAVNGTVGAIAADITVNNQSFEVLPNGGSENPTDSTQIEIVSVNTPPTLTLAETLPDSEVGETTTFTLADLNPAIADADNDITTVEIASIPEGTLRRDGVILQPGDAIASTDTLEFTPPTDISGTATVLTIQAQDGVSNSVPVEIDVTLVEPPDPEVIDPDPEVIDPEPEVVDPEPDIGEPDPDVLDLDLDVSDPNLGIREVFAPQLLTGEETVLTGMSLARSPQLEELSVMGMVLPEPGFLIVDASIITARTNSGSSSGANFPSSFTTGEPEPVFSLPDPVDDQPDPGELQEPDPGELQEPDPGELQEPDPNELQEPDSSELQEPASDELPESNDVLPLEQNDAESATEGTPSDDTESSTDIALADESPDVTDTNLPAATAAADSDVNQGLKNCQAEAQGIRSVAGGDRTQSLYESLIGCYESNLTTATEQGDAQWVGYSLNNLAIAHFVIGDYLTALELHEQQLEQAIATSDPTQEGMALGGIGAAYAALGEYETAIEFYEQSLRVTPIETAPQWKALTYRNLGNAYFAQEEYESAADQQITSLDISRGAGDIYGEMQAYGNLASTRAIQGQFDEAIALYEEGLVLADALNNKLEAAQLLLGISTTYAYQQNYENAYLFSQDALDITRQLGANLGEGIALTNVGNALLYLERLTEAESALFEAIAVWESVRAGLGTNDAFKISIFETQSAAYRNLQEVLVAQGNTSSALEISERGRARAFVELLARGQATATDAALPPNLAQMQQIAAAQNTTLVEYSIIRDQIAEPPHAASVQNPITPQDAKLYVWVVSPSGTVQFRQVDLQDTLAATAIAGLVGDARDALLGRDLTLVASRGLGVVSATDDRPLQPGDLVKRKGDLPDLTPYEIVSVSPDGQTVTVQHPEFTLPDPVLPVSEVYRVEGGTMTLPPLQQMHDLLIAPIADLLPTDPDALVTFVPQEQLFLVPFAALQDEQNTYLIEQHTFTIAPSIQTLALTQRNTGASTEVLVVGNPSPMPDDKFAPLPNAELEALTIAEMLATDPLVRGNATESEVKASLATANIIHLATHGEFNSRQPLQGAIALAPDARNDGLLTAAEILDLSLQANLAILSACDTGRGQITGDGVIGLSRSFMAAGVPEVVVSLWPVPDAQTAELMIDFHEARLEGDRTPHALRKAMLTSLETYDDPAIWSAFTQIGNLE